jgi:hypothetical protein
MTASGPFAPIRHPRAWLTTSVILVLVGAGAVAVSLSSRDTARPGARALGPPSNSRTASASGSPSLGAPSPTMVSPSTVAKSRARSPSRPAASTRVGPPVGGAWPNAGNAGVPAGTPLKTYTGSCRITQANIVIDAKVMNCDVEIRAAHVTIKRSKINGAVVLDTDVAGSNKWSYTLADSEVDAGLRQFPAVSYGNMTIIRSDISGGQTSVQCGEKALACEVRDSWLHGQRIPSTASWHLGGFLSNGGHTIRIRHNTIVCDAPVNSAGEGCTGDLNLFGDFAVISDVIVDSNFLGANTGSSYCLYGGDALSKPYPHADHVVVTNNVFQRGTNNKCGAYGPVSSFNIHGPGNVWANNTWDKAGAVSPAM